MRLNDFILRGSEVTINGRLMIETESLAGNTSASDRANNGIKPKAIIVSLLLKFSDREHLRELVRLAEAVDENGKLVVYDILDDTAAAMGVRQVQFSDALNVRQIPGRDGWRINFNLLEYLSIPEKTEQREQAQSGAEAPEEQTSPGEEIADSGTTEDSGPREYTGFERWLKAADDALAPEEAVAGSGEGTADAVA